MRKANGASDRPINLALLAALEAVGRGPVTARELAVALGTSPGSVAPALRGPVKAGLVRRYWGELRSVRTYALTDAGREFLALQRDVAPVII